MSYSSEVLADSPLAYWKLDETSGTNAADSSGNSRDATYSSGITLGAASLLASGSGAAASFTANTSTGVAIANASWMAVSALTVDCLVNFSSAVDGTNGDAIVSHYGGSGFKWLLWRNTAGKLAFQLQLSGGSFINCTGTTTPTLGTTYHVAATWDGSNIRLYVNGTLETTTAASGSLASSTESMRIACYSGSASTVPGAVIDEVAVYGTALSGTRVTAHYNASTSTSDSASGTGSLTLSGSGSAAAPASGSGALSLSGSGATYASGSGSLSLSAAGSGNAAASGAGSLSLSGTGVVSAGGAGSLTLSAGGTGIVTYNTDTSNDLDGLDLLLSAAVTFAPAVVAAPPTLVLATKVDKAIAYPTPTMVNGRPT